MSVKYNEYFLKDENGLFTTCKSALAHFPYGQSATFNTHRTGENMRTGSRSSNSRWCQRKIKTPVQDFSQQSRQKTCPMGRAESEDCHSVSAALQQNANPLPLITRFARIKQKRSGDFRLFPPANFANSAILPTDKISTFFMQNFLPQKPKDSTIRYQLPPLARAGRSTESREYLARTSVCSGRAIT